MRYLILLTLFSLASCGPYEPRHTHHHPDTKIYVDQIPPEMIPWEILKKRVYPSDENLEQLQDRYITKIVFFAQGNKRYFFNDNSTLDKRYVKSTLGDFDWKQNVCAEGSGEINGYDIATSDEEDTNYSRLYTVRGACQEKLVSCALIETQFDGDMVFELEENGCSEFSFGYNLE